MPFGKSLRIGDSTTIYVNGSTEIVLRKGVWNFEEALLDLSPLEDPLQSLLLRLFETLGRGESVCTTTLDADYAIRPQDIDVVLTLLDELAEQAFLVPEGSDESARLMKMIIGGSAIGLDRAVPMTGSSTLLVCDAPLVGETITRMADSMQLHLTEMTPEDVTSIARADLTSRLDSMDHDAAMTSLRQITDRFDCVLVCLQRPHIKFLRNLNRLLLPRSVPMALAMLDGPFLTALTTKAPETGCFECYENRVMARLQDISAYRRFVEVEPTTRTDMDGSGYQPLLTSVGCIALQEAFLIDRIHKAKLAGRVLNIFVPMLEIQVQDLLRVPYCSACGHIARAEYQEMYTSSSKIVESLLSTVDIVRS